MQGINENTNYREPKILLILIVKCFAVEAITYSFLSLYQAVGVPDDRMGEEICAYVQLQ